MRQKQNNRKGVVVVVGVGVGGCLFYSIQSEVLIWLKIHQNRCRQVPIHLVSTEQLYIINSDYIYIYIHLHPPPPLSLALWLDCCDAVQLASTSMDRSGLRMECDKMLWCW